MTVIDWRWSSDKVILIPPTWPSLVLFEIILRHISTMNCPVYIFSGKCVTPNKFFVFVFSFVQQVEKGQNKTLNPRFCSKELYCFKFCIKCRWLHFSLLSRSQCKHKQDYPRVKVWGLLNAFPVCSNCIAKKNLRSFLRVWYCLFILILCSSLPSTSLLQSPSAYERERGRKRQTEREIEQLVDIYFG